MKNKCILLFIVVLSMFSVVFGILETTLGEESSVYITPMIYQSEDDKGYSFSEEDKVNILIFGRKMMGACCITGDIKKQGTYGGWSTIGVDKKCTIEYDLDFPSDYTETDKKKWHLVNDNSKQVDSISLSKKIGKGVLIIQSSSSPDFLEYKQDIQYDFFDKYESGDSLLSLTSEQIVAGTYIRIILAYRMGRVIEEGKNLLYPDTYEYKNCLEKYEFFITYENNPIDTIEIIQHAKLLSGSHTSSGFYIKKNGSTENITISMNGGIATEAKEFYPYVEPGSYTIKTTSKLGSTYNRSITIDEGLSMTELTPIIYEEESQKGYVASNDFLFPFEKSHTSLYLSQSNGYQFVVSEKTQGDKTIPAYGLGGTNVSLFLKINPVIPNDKEGWHVLYDKWGKRSKQGIDNTFAVGEVGKGTVILQTSKDGINWSQTDSEHYANGIYTTDFETHYPIGEMICLYQVDGDMILRKEGVYIRILYVYQAGDIEEKNTRDFIEEYIIYLCNNQFDGVTFHNKSISDKDIKKIAGDDNEELINLYFKAETMTSGSLTRTGFSIDNSINSSIQYHVYRNGVLVPFPEDKDAYYSLPGKYEIKMSNSINETQTVVLYVNSMSIEEINSVYFGEGFIQGHRLYFEEGQYPAYEGGLTSFHIEAIPENYPALRGTIYNQSTGKEYRTISFEETRNGLDEIIEQPGEYIAVFTNAPDSITAAGDIISITFNFNILAKGVSSAPRINRERLYGIYSHSYPSDFYPVHYGVRFSSLGNDFIEIYQNQQEAEKCAYDYFAAKKEALDGGKYLYQGIEYSSNKDVTSKIYSDRDEIVDCYYFDLSKEFTFRTITDYTCMKHDDPRAEHLNESVRVFPSDRQREALFVSVGEDVKPFINDKKFSFLEMGEGELHQTGKDPFIFTQDKYMCDSATVQIMDENGNLYNIEYNESVEEQLKLQECPSGIVTILETNIYGISAEPYEAIYIRENENTAVITLDVQQQGIVNKVPFSQQTEIKTIEANAFSISSFIDRLDPYSLIIIDRDNETIAFCASDFLLKDTWEEPGDYCITIRNRLGYGFSIMIKVSEPIDDKSDLEESLVITDSAMNSIDNSPGELLEDKPEVSADTRPAEIDPSLKRKVLGIGCIVFLFVIIVFFIIRYFRTKKRTNKANDE